MKKSSINCKKKGRKEFINKKEWQFTLYSVATPVTYLSVNIRIKYCIAIINIQSILLHMTKYLVICENTIGATVRIRNY